MTKKLALRAAMVILFAAAGIYVLVASHAAAPVTNAFEAESGTPSGNATKITDAGASGGEGVRFDAPVASGTFAVAVSGKNFIDGSGKTVRLHGINRSGSEYACTYGSYFDGPSDASSIDAMLPWHINTVRVPVNEQCWLGINGLPSGYSAAQYQQAMTTYINLLVSKKMYVVLDLHWTAAGTNKSNAQTPMPDRDHAPAFWASAANTFKNNPAVIFDLFNEPYPDNNSGSTAAWTCWKNGGTCGSDMPYTVAGMQELVTTVRNTGATNVILLGGVQYSGNTSQINTYKPTDPLNQLAGSQHTYDNQYKFCVTSDCWDANYNGVGNMPFMAGELGDGYCTADYPLAYMAWADAKGASYLGWAWDVQDCSGFPAVISSYDGTPTAFGQAFKTHFTQLFP